MRLFASSSLFLLRPKRKPTDPNNYISLYTYRERSKKQEVRRNYLASMAVEAQRLNLFPSHLIRNREMMNAIEGNMSAYNSTPIGYGLPPMSVTTTETLLPMYNSVIADSLPPKTSMKADSGLTCVLPVSRKRSRDSVNPLISLPNGQDQNGNNNRRGFFTFLGEDISLQIQQQQFEIDRFIAQHTEMVRLEIEERQKRYSRRIIAAVEEGVMKRLRAKEEEIEKIGKLNWALEEKVKSLYIENQIWRDLAHTNEATANALRSNLEQVLAQVNDEQQHRGCTLDDAAAAALMDDAQSCCGSNCGGIDEETRTLAACGGGGRRDVVKDKCHDACTTSSRSGNDRLCRHCGKVESCVVMLPCRHLCLCTVCGSLVHTCPVCNTAKKASVHVIISS